MAYKVGKFSGVGEQMRALADRAKLVGIRQRYLEALQEMLERLQLDPLDFGDPLYRTKHEGGVVCHAMIDPIIVHFAVFEVDQTVLIIDIQPAFDWPIRP
jgi:hypothetical protein